MSSVALTATVAEAIPDVYGPDGKVAPLIVVITAVENLLAAREAEVRERIAQELLDVDPVEWALAGQWGGHKAARIARGES